MYIFNIPPTPISQFALLWIISGRLCLLSLHPLTPFPQSLFPPFFLWMLIGVGWNVQYSVGRGSMCCWVDMFTNLFLAVWSAVYSPTKNRIPLWGPFHQLCSLIKYFKALSSENEKLGKRRPGECVSGEQCFRSACVCGTDKRCVSVSDEQGQRWGRMQDQRCVTLADGW